MPELHKIGSILVAVASLSTFFFATKELLLNPPMNHHGRQLAVEPAMGFDPKTISYKDTTVNTVADQAAGYTGAMATTTTTTTGTARRSEPMLQDHPMRPQLAYGTANTEQQGESSTGDAGGEALKDTSTFGDMQTRGGGLATATTLSRDGTGGFGDSSAGETQSGGFGASSNAGMQQSGGFGASNGGTQQAGGFGASSNGGMQQSGGFGTSSGGTQQAGASSNGDMQQSGGFGTSSNGDTEQSGGFGSSSKGGTQQAGGFGASSNGGTQQAGGFGASSNGGMQQAGGFGASSNVAEMSEQQGVGMMQQQTGMQTGQSQMSSRRRLEFVHITKTGGTAIETAAADQANIMWGACHYRSIKYQKCDSPDWPSPKSRVKERMPDGLFYMGEPWHCPPHWQLPNMFEDVDTFVVVRNPYERVVSEYYCSSYGYKGPDPDSLETFQNWVTGNVTEVITSIHGHMLPQNYYVYDENGNKVIDHILRYENLSEEFDALMKEYGLPVTLPSKKDSAQIFHTYSRKGAVDAKHMTMADLSPANIKLINEVYSRDFEFFGYEMIQA